jgi:hypothetical protein
MADTHSFLEYTRCVRAVSGGRYDGDRLLPPRGRKQRLQRNSITATEMVAYFSDADRIRIDPSIEPFEADVSELTRQIALAGGRPDKEMKLG